MILRTSPASPFGRKVVIAASLLGLGDSIAVVNADTTDPGDSLRAHNPLGKIPTLVDDDGTAWYDSRVILEVIDARAGATVHGTGEVRLKALKLQALADGLMDACLLQVYENRMRDPDKREPKWIEHQAGKVERTLALLEADPPGLSGAIDIGHIAVACALGYLDLRFAGTWRETHPRLVAWLDAFAARVPAFEETRVKA
ncbi:MAG: glutathione S-transferase family protein [Burkholderiales bacterium]|nr:glutathione S-transferase family protein [Burkholderiales bacterium]